MNIPQNIPQEWQKVIDNIIAREVPPGKPVVNTPGDPGGLTAWGISQAAHPDIDVSKLTKGEAVAIYWGRYITPANLHLLKDIAIGERLADFGVVCGIGAMSYAVKVALFLLNRTSDASRRLLTVEEVEDINNLKGASRTAFIRLVNAIQGLIFFMGWVQARRAIAEALANPHRRPFLRGWISRRIWEVNNG